MSQQVREPEALARLADQIRTAVKREHNAIYDQVTSLREFCRANGHELFGYSTCAQWLSRVAGLSPSTARERVRVARALKTLPALNAAFADQTLCYSKVRALTRIGNDEPESALIETGRELSTAGVERWVRSKLERKRGVKRPGTRFVRKREITATGMVRIEIQLHPEEAEEVWSAMSRATRAVAAVSPPEEDKATLAELVVRIAKRWNKRHAPAETADSVSPAEQEQVAPTDRCPTSPASPWKANGLTFSSRLGWSGAPPRSTRAVTAERAGQPSAPG